jgi:D-alanine-D-alanine ligase
MGHLVGLRVVVVHNQDFDPNADLKDDPTLASRADVENAARDVVRALTTLGHQAQTLPVPSGQPAVAALETIRTLESLRPDLVFNLCESLAGDARHEAVLPSLFELAGIRYTGSGPQALGLALRKDLTKKLLVAQGVSTPGAVTLDSDDVSGVELPFPLIVKPTREDASVGITRDSVVHDRASLARRVADVRREFRQPVLIEQYIEGREIYVSMLGQKPHVLPMHEIDFSAMPAHKPRIVSYEGKWDASSDEYHGTRSVRCGELDAVTRARCHAAARAAFLALELRDYARVDLRVSADGVPYVIDVNPNCDLSDGAGVSRAASYGGLDYPQLIQRICDAALGRYEPESENHVHPAHASDPVEEPAVAVAGGEGRASHPPLAGGGPEPTREAGLVGRTVHPGRGVGRARADRRRAR